MGTSGLLKFPALLLISLVPVVSFAQEPTTASAAPPNASGPNPIVSLASEFFEHDFFNIYAYGSGVYDSYAPVERNGQTVNNGSFGINVGGGIDTVHSFQNGEISLSYAGGYQDYQNSYYSSGITQNLSLGLVKRLSRHWTFSWSAGAGIYRYGGTFLNSDQTASNTIVSNPFSPATKFLSTGIGLTYQQTRRLSYSFSGAFSLQRYNYPGSIGATGGSGSASVSYRLQPRTTVSGSYVHSYFQYQRNAGQATVDGVSLNLTHYFPNHWTVGVSGGISRSNANGIVTVPVTLIIGTQAVGGYVLGTYHQVTYIPSFSVSASHNFHHYIVSLNGGQGVAPGGNGYFLSSRSDYLNGVASHSFNRRSSLSAGGGYFRLASVANSVSSSYTTTTISANYGINLFRYVGTFVRYDFVHYGTLRPYNGVSDNRISFGFNFSSKSIPMTLF